MDTQTKATLSNLRYRRERLLLRLIEAEVKLAKIDAEIKEMESALCESPPNTPS